MWVINFFFSEKDKGNNSITTSYSSEDLSTISNDDSFVQHNNDDKNGCGDDIGDNIIFRDGNKNKFVKGENHDEMKAYVNYDKDKKNIFGDYNNDDKITLDDHNNDDKNTFSSLGDESRNSFGGERDTSFEFSTSILKNNNEDIDNNLSNKGNNIATFISDIEKLGNVDHENIPFDSDDNTKVQLKDSKLIEVKEDNKQDEKLSFEANNRDITENIKGIEKTEAERAKRLHEDLKKISTIQLDYSRKLRGKLVILK